MSVKGSKGYRLTRELPDTIEFQGEGENEKILRQGQDFTIDPNGYVYFPEIFLERYGVYHFKMCMYSSTLGAVDPSYCIPITINVEDGENGAEAHIDYPDDFPCFFVRAETCGGPNFFDDDPLLKWWNVRCGQLKQDALPCACKKQAPWQFPAPGDTCGCCKNGVCKLMPKDGPRHEFHRTSYDKINDTLTYIAPENLIMTPVVKPNPPTPTYLPPGMVVGSPRVFTPKPIETKDDDNGGSCGLIEFPPLSFNAPGDYTYYVKEVSGPGNGWQLDETVFTVVIHVTRDPAGGLTADVEYPDGYPTFVNVFSPVLKEPIGVQIIGFIDGCGMALEPGMFDIALYDEEGDLIAIAKNGPERFDIKFMPNETDALERALPRIKDKNKCKCVIPIVGLNRCSCHR